MVSLAIACYEGEGVPRKGWAALEHNVPRPKKLLNTFGSCSSSGQKVQKLSLPTDHSAAGNGALLVAHGLITNFSEKV